MQPVKIQLHVKYKLCLQESIPPSTLQKPNRLRNRYEFDMESPKSQNSDRRKPLKEVSNLILGSHFPFLVYCLC